MQHDAAATDVQHFNHILSLTSSCLTKGVLATYSSSRCRCDSTMVMGKCGQGREGSVGKRWILCSCFALLNQEMSCADPSNTGEDELCTPVAGSWFYPDKKTQTERRGMQKSAPQLPDSRDERCGKPADQSPAKSTLHLKRRGRESQH